MSFSCATSWSFTEFFCFSPSSGWLLFYPSRPWNFNFFSFSPLPLSPSPSYFPVSSPCLCLSSSLFLSPGLAPPKPTKIAYSKGLFPLCDPHFLKGISSSLLPWNRRQTNFSVFSVIKILEIYALQILKRIPKVVILVFSWCLQVFL